MEATSSVAQPTDPALEKIKQIFAIAPIVDLLVLRKVCSYIENKKEKLFEKAPYLKSTLEYPIYISKTKNIYIIPRGNHFLLGRGSSKSVYLGINYLKAKLIAHCLFDEEAGLNKTVSKLTRSQQSAYEKIQCQKKLILNDINFLNLLKMGSPISNKSIPGVLKLIDDDEISGKFFTVFKYYNLGTLEGLIQNQSLNHAKKIKIAFDLISGLNYLHQKGIQHNDIKDDNILLKSKMINGTVQIKSVLADFGHATQGAGDSKYDFGGTPIYYSPEKWCSITSNSYTGIISFSEGTQSDVWALGCVLYNLFFEQFPWGYALYGLHSTTSSMIFVKDKAAILIGECAKEALEKHPKDAISLLIEEMLSPDSKKRITAEQAFYRINKLVVPPIKLQAKYPSDESLDTLDSEDTKDTSSRETSSSRVFSRESSSSNPKTHRKRTERSKSLSENL